MDSIPQDKPHYVYTLAYPDGIVFYVGKGIKARIDDHEREARKGVISHKCKVIRKIWANGEQVVKTKIAYFATHKEACMYEIALIFFLPNLTNKTVGGDGIEDLTGELRRKSGESRKGQTPHNKGKSMWNEADRHRISETNRKRAGEKRRKYRPWSEEARQKVTGRPSPQKGRVRSAEQRRTISESHKGIVSKPAGWHHTPETCQKMSEGLKRRAAEKRNRHQLEFTEMSEASGE